MKLVRNVKHEGDTTKDDLELATWPSEYHVSYDVYVLRRTLAERLYAAKNNARVRGQWLGI